ncbi:3-phenylpropionate dioxygenase subunit alpha [Klebsiella pneumoniae]|uniref:3-phenylpropionate dioxygenase subunit alpha n=1 Tax=Klebsiella pneumoniae TaxID=573 RepID=A0A377XBB7_KLEPN|nr:3-phenylpropionate dioxygenase subunit alpha [Klebsiella pneumoniae]
MGWGRRTTSKSSAPVSAAISAKNLPWSDLSRGALRWVDGADEHAQHAGFSPRLSGVKSEDEALYIAHHHHWQTLMLAAIEQEQQRYDQSITQRVEVA